MAAYANSYLYFRLALLHLFGESGLVVLVATIKIERIPVQTPLRCLETQPCCLFQPNILIF